MNLPINHDLKQRFQRCVQYEGRTEKDVLEFEIRKYVEMVEERMRNTPQPTHPLYPPYRAPLQPYQPFPSQPLTPYPLSPYYVGDQIPNPWYVGDTIPDPWRTTCSTNVAQPRN